MSGGFGAQEELILHGVSAGTWVFRVECRDTLVTEAFDIEQVRSLKLFEPDPIPEQPKRAANDQKSSC